MRTEDEIVQAHDKLVAVLLGEIKLPYTDEERRHINIQATVLCWVLGHEHNKVFGECLRHHDRAAEAAGYRLKKLPEPTTHGEFIRRQKE